MTGGPLLEDPITEDESTIQTARASTSPGLRQVCGWSPWKCRVYCPGSTVLPGHGELEHAAGDLPVSSPGCCIGLRPLLAPSAAPPRHQQQEPAVGGMLFSSMPW